MLPHPSRRVTNGPAKAEIPLDPPPPIDRAKVLADARPAHRKAYLVYEYAESKAGRRLTDREAYDLLKEEGLPTDKGHLGELEGYKLPEFETWTKYLRVLRNALD